MCGISGILAFHDEPVQREEIAAQIETMVHRGPDQGAVYLSPGGRCGLGIRRLRIIDVAGGDQPLSNEDRSLHLVYNGETYNHRALRAELEALGHAPRSHSDGEVVLHGYEAWGVAGLLEKLRGMGVFALWDDTRQRLWLVRDRFGIKPLYYAQGGGRLHFASEIKAILADPAVPRRVNLPALAAMLRLGFVPGPETMFEGIYKLPPAHFLLAGIKSFRIVKYWQLDYRAEVSLSEAEAAEQFLALLREAVDLRLMSEVPLGALLSGGLDSGTLVALMAGQEGRGCPAAHDRLKTVSIGFEDAAYDETSPARALAEFIGTAHHPVTFTAANFEDYPEVMTHLEEPQCSATAVPIYNLYRACRQIGLTVVLTGEGADELLGGYHWHRGDALMRPLLSLPALLRQVMAALPLPVSTAARRVLARGNRGPATRYQDWLEVGGYHRYRKQLLSGEVKQALGDNLSNGDSWAGKIDTLPVVPPLHRMLWLEAQTRLVDFINFEVDKMSMAHSIEARVPFLDHKLWEFCAGLPVHYKLKGRTEKYLLRLATRGLLPEATRGHPKKGLAAPYSRWLQAKRLPEWAEVALSRRSLKTAGLFDPTAVTHLRRAHQAGRPDLGALLMGVLSTQVWVDCFIK